LKTLPRCNKRWRRILIHCSNNGGILNAGAPEKITIAGQSKPPVLSPEKKQVLEQDQAKTHYTPQLSTSDQPVLGPALGTQVQ